MALGNMFTIIMFINCCRISKPIVNLTIKCLVHYIPSLDTFTQMIRQKKKRRGKYEVGSIKLLPYNLFFCHIL